MVISVGKIRRFIHVWRAEGTRHALKVLAEIVQLSSMLRTEKREHAFWCATQYVITGDYRGNLAAQQARQAKRKGRTK